jgi:hypothetical protein
MAQKSKHTKNNRKPLGRSRVMREEGGLEDELLNRARKSREKGAR